MYRRKKGVIYGKKRRKVRKMIATAKILAYNGETLLIKPLVAIDRELIQKQIDSIEIRLVDGREISAEQRRKIFAIIRDISVWSGHEPEYIRMYTEFDYRLQHGLEPFSLSDCDVTTAREYISYLIDFCFNNGVPTRDTLLNHTDDIGKYLYSCLEYRKCAVCNDKADIHHIDTVGAGRNRDTIAHKGLRAVALCRKHHIEAHKMGQAFFDKWHIYGIILDDYLCKILNLRKETKK
jgi:hypothetical protein